MNDDEAQENLVKLGTILEQHGPDTIQKFLNDLEAKSKEVTQGAVLQVTDLTLPYSHLFNAAAKAALPFKQTRLDPERFNTLRQPIYDKVMYLSLTAMGPDAIYKAAREIADAINYMAAKGFVTGYLSPLSMLSLYNHEYECKLFAVFCFPSISPEGQDWITNSEDAKSLPFVEEGYCGRKVE